MAETEVVAGPFTVTGPLTTSTAVGVPESTGMRGVVNALRFRATTAQVNAAAPVLPALPGLKYRVHHFSLIAIGGAAAAPSTQVRVSGTRAETPAHLFIAPVAVLTQDALVSLWTATTILQGSGASFAELDVNTPITVNSNGTLTGATHIDVLLVYSIHR